MGVVQRFIIKLGKIITGWAKKILKRELESMKYSRSTKKTSEKYDFISTIRYFEQAGIYLIEFRSEGVYVVMAIDYFARRMWARMLETKSVAGVVYFLKKLCQRGNKPEEIITDNRREFRSEK